MPKKNLIIMISTDGKIFDSGSAVHERMVHYAGLFDELHIVVMKKERGRGRMEIAQNCWAYSTNSFSKLFYIKDAQKVVLKEVVSRFEKESRKDTNIILDAQDPFETGLAALGALGALQKIGTREIKLRIQIHTDFMNPRFRKTFLNSIRFLIAKRVLPHADAIRVVSERIKNSLMPIKIPITVLPIYVDATKYHRRFQDATSRYPQFNFVALSVSRLTFEKNLPCAIHAFAEVVKKHPKAGLVIVGDGPKKHSLIRLALRLGIRDSVVFEGWQADPAPFFASAHLYLSTSFYEGYGMSLIEAALSGVPIVSSDVGIIGEVFADGKDVRVCHSFSRHCWVGTIDACIESLPMRLDMKMRAHAAARAHLSYSFAEYCERYKKALLF